MRCQWKCFGQDYESWKQINATDGATEIADVLSFGEIERIATSGIGVAGEGFGKRGNGSAGKSCDGGVTGSKKDAQPKKVITVRVSDLQPVGGHKDEVGRIYSDAGSIHEFGASVGFCFSVLRI